MVSYEDMFLWPYSQHCQHYFDVCYNLLQMLRKLDYEDHCSFQNDVSKKIRNYSFDHLPKYKTNLFSWSYFLHLLFHSGEKNSQAFCYFLMNHICKYRARLENRTERTIIRKSLKLAYFFATATKIETRFFNFLLHHIV